MKTAAGVVAVLAWGGFLAAMWYPLVVDGRPPLGAWLAIAEPSFAFWDNEVDNDYSGL